MNASTGEMVALACNLARNCGYAVFPCRDDKRPACPHSFKDAAKDPAAIADLWRRYPGSLIGIACGADSGLAVLDVDIQHNSARAWWHDNRRLLPDTFYCRTRSGGVHGYLQHAPGIKCSVARPVNGIDIRGQGGYAVHWPSAGFNPRRRSPRAVSGLAAKTSLATTTAGATSQSERTEEHRDADQMRPRGTGKRPQQQALLGLPSYAGPRLW